MDLVEEEEVIVVDEEVSQEAVEEVSYTFSQSAEISRLILYDH